MCIRDRLYSMLQKFAPFGPNNTIPVFMTENVTNFIGTRRVGRNNEHLKLVVVDETLARIHILRVATHGDATGRLCYVQSPEGTMPTGGNKSRIKNKAEIIR